MQVFSSATSLRNSHPGFTSRPVQNRLQLCQGFLTRRPFAEHHRRCIIVTKGIFDAFLGRNNAEEEEGPTFEAIDPESDGGLGGTSEDLFGPLAVILVGYAQYEVDQFRAFMIDMDADMVKILTCTKRMLSSTLQDSLDAPAQVFEQLPLSTKRAVFLSGMSGAEVQEVISAYNDSALPPTVWAAAVPANYQRTISNLLEDIYGDHNLMVQREQELLRLRQQLESRQ